MDRPTSYEDDIYAWSQAQAAVLRRLAATRRDLPNELDLEHVAEEIEDVGKSEVRTVESFLELLLRHLLKVASAPEARPGRHWRGEIDIQHRALRKDLKRSMFQLIELDDVWRTAKLRAEKALEENGDALVEGLPPAAPFELEEFLANSFDIDRAVDRIRRSCADSTAEG